MSLIPLQLNSYNAKTANEQNHHLFGTFATVGRLAADFFMGGLLLAFRTLGFALDKVVLGHSFLRILLCCAVNYHPRDIS
jgi:hypothetical protein